MRNRVMNNIESNFVPYQIAFDMKSIGFDEPCFFSYDYWNTERLADTYYNYVNYNVREKSISAPLYQQAFRWFREKYNLDKVIYPTLGSEGNYYINIFKNYNSDNSLYWNCSYETLEEAELECLKKLIEIVVKK
jgi:hypothetical protein